MSKKTTDAERKYSSYELEVLAIVDALKKFRVYLLGFPFKIITDCAAFEKTMNKKDLTTRIARWALLLEEFDYTIQHRSGTRMRHVDALSRYPVMFVTENSVLSRIKKLQQEPPSLKPIIEILNSRPDEEYFLQNGALYKTLDDKNVLVLPDANIVSPQHPSLTGSALKNALQCITNSTVPRGQVQ